MESWTQADNNHNTNIHLDIGHCVACDVGSSVTPVRWNSLYMLYLSPSSHSSSSHDQNVTAAVSLTTIIITSINLLEQYVHFCSEKIGTFFTLLQWHALFILFFLNQ